MICQNLDRTLKAAPDLHHGRVFYLDCIEQSEETHCLTGNSPGHDQDLIFGNKFAPIHERPELSQEKTHGIDAPVKVR